MNKFALALGFASFAAFADQAPMTVHQCSIQPGWVYCPGGGNGGYDEGCQVTCKNKRAICLAASGFAPIDPNHSFPTNCEVIPSSCYCKK